jgi:hypothetical protein
MSRPAEPPEGLGLDGRLGIRLRTRDQPPVNPDSDGFPWDPRPEGGGLMPELAVLVLALIVIYTAGRR